VVLERLRLDGPPRRVALVTGGGRGLGREMARSLSEAGAEVVLVSRTAAQLDATATMIESYTGRRPLTVAADLRRSEEMDRAVAEAVAAFGRIDVLVNNAGVGDRRGTGPDIAALSDDDWRDAQAVNLDSAFFGCRAAVRQFRHQGGSGVIINVGSGMGIRAAPMALGYSAAKGGVAALTRSLAAQVAAEGIRVNCIVPGFVFQAPPRDEAEAEAYRQRGRFNTIGRFGAAWELGPLTVLLASDASSYITGELFVIDGGGMAGGIAPLGQLHEVLDG
jgi:NAD(P)-dependent dehydrogenase (short-subunit alcohol dehydrogenase family)